MRYIFFQNIKKTAKFNNCNKTKAKNHLSPRKITITFAPV